MSRVAFLVVAAAAGFAAFAPQPAPAQATERVLTIFGDDECPRDTICVRAPENERYRIPKELREDGVIPPENQSWASRVESMEYVGRSGTMSCSPSGPGGWTGCYAQMLREAREERRQAEQTQGYPPPE